MTASATPRQVNLYNPALLPKRENFSARQIAAGVVVAALAIGAVSWWAASESRALRREVQEQERTRAARTAGALAAPTLDGRPVPTPEQVTALEQGLQAKAALLQARKASLDSLKRGMAGAEAGPSALMRLMATSIPPSTWLSEMRVSGSRLDIVGKALDPADVDGWLARLRASGFLAASPSPTLRLERIEAPTPAGRARAAYQFTLSAALSSPFADEAARP